MPLSEFKERSAPLEKVTTSTDPINILQPLASNESLLPVLEFEVEHPPPSEKATTPIAWSNDAVVQSYEAVAPSLVPESPATTSQRPRPPRVKNAPTANHPGNFPPPVESNQNEEEPFTDPDVYRILCMRVHFACILVAGLLVIPDGLIMLNCVASGSNVARAILMPTVPPRRTSRGVIRDTWSGVSP